MILREPEDGARLLIPQPSHALLSGQIMAAWGAPGFARPEPAAEVVLAAGQHDIAWKPWEAAPTLDARTGLPHSFTAIGPATHAPMWAEESTFSLADDATRRLGEQWREGLGIGPEDVLVLYAGALGHAQGLETLIDAAAAVDDPRLRVVVAGSGVAEEALRARAAKTAPAGRILVPGRVPQSQMPVLMAAADVCFVGLAATPLTRITMPSKTQATLATGKAILVAADGDIRQVVADSGAGWAVGSGDVAGLTGAMRLVCNSGRGGLAARGHGARSHYERHFGLARALDRAEEHLEAARASVR